MDEFNVLSDELTPEVTQAPDPLEAPEAPETQSPQEENTENDITSDHEDLVAEEAQEDDSDEHVPDTAEKPQEPSDPPMPPEQNFQEEISALRADVARLQAELQAQATAFDRMSRECAEFTQLYPDQSISSVPGDVWESVRNGVPLAAAFALYQVKADRKAQLAEQVNSRNRLTSSGGVSGDGDPFLSPAEVRRMKPAQVRENYSKIIESMKLWN